MNSYLENSKSAGVAYYGRDLRHPAQVARDPCLTTAQKREILADWASDRRAAPNDPELRLSATGALAAIDDIMSALKQLDAPTIAVRPFRPRSLREILPRRSKLRMGEAIQFARRRPGRDDDDPPPAPAAARVPRPPAPPTTGEATYGNKELCHA